MGNYQRVGGLAGGLHRAPAGHPSVGAAAAGPQPRGDGDPCPRAGTAGVSPDGSPRTWGLWPGAAMLDQQKPQGSVGWGSAGSPQPAPPQGEVPLCGVPTAPGTQPRPPRARRTPTPAARPWTPTCPWTRTARAPGARWRARPSSSSRGPRYRAGGTPGGLAGPGGADPPSIPSTSRSPSPCAPMSATAGRWTRSARCREPPSTLKPKISCTSRR